MQQAELFVTPTAQRQSHRGLHFAVRFASDAAVHSIGQAAVGDTLASRNKAANPVGRRHALLTFFLVCLECAPLRLLGMRKQRV